MGRHNYKCLAENLKTLHSDHGIIWHQSCQNHDW
jgi:hypothetical protein